jgi:hypothetical protein
MRSSPRAEPRAQDLALPPGENGLSLVLLDPEVGRDLGWREGLKPYELTLLIDDHGARCARALVRGEEQVARARAGLRPRCHLQLRGREHGRG